MPHAAATFASLAQCGARYMAVMQTQNSNKHSVPDWLLEQQLAGLPGALCAEDGNGCRWGNDPLAGLCTLLKARCGFVCNVQGTPARTF